MDESMETVSLSCSHYFKLLTDGMWHQYEKQEGTDLMIRFNGSNIRVHRFLFTIFAPQMLDQITDSLLDLSDEELDQDVLFSIVEFLYKGEVIFFKDKLEVLKSGAGKLGLDLVVNAIDEFFRIRFEERFNECSDLNEEEEDLKVGEEVVSVSDNNNCTEVESATELVLVSELEWCETTVKSPSLNVEIQETVTNHEEEVVEEMEPASVQKHENVICESQLENVDLWDLCLEKELPAVESECKVSEENEKDSVTQFVVIQPKKLCFKCSHCSYKSFDRTGFKKHLANKHRSTYVVKSKKPYNCPHCDFVAELRLELSRHIQNIHSSDRPFACDQCSYRAKTQIDLRYHKKRHSGVKFSCETCGRKCSSYSGLCQHRKLHTIREKPNICHFCGYASSRKGDLNKHMENVHDFVGPKTESLDEVTSKQSSYSMKTTEYRCVHCDYKTNIRVRWKNHLAAQHQLDPQGNPAEPKVECDQCDFKCLLQYQLAGHKAKAHPTKHYRCSECDHVTHLKANLDVHVKSKHREERPYVCQTCNFSTKTSSQLKSHLRSHSDEKFFCDLCNNGYSSKQHLKRHLIVMHDPNARRHACDLCTFVTKTKDALQQHVKRMHKNEAV